MCVSVHECTQIHEHAREHMHYVDSEQVTVTCMQICLPCKEVYMLRYVTICIDNHETGFVDRKKSVHADSPALSISSSLSAGRVY